MFAAEIFPSQVEEFIGGGVTDAAEALGLGGGAMVGDHAECLGTAHPGAEFDGFGEFQGHDRFLETVRMLTAGLLSRLDLSGFGRKDGYGNQGCGRVWLPLIGCWHGVELVFGGWVGM